MNEVHDPPDVRRERVGRHAGRRKRRKFCNRHVLITVLQVATAIVKLVRLVISMFDGS